MNELRKGTSSFYYPYLRILPGPGTISEWSSDQLEELQDDSLTLRARRKRLQLNTMFDRSVLPLINKYPSLFPSDEFTYEDFKFSWYSVQARAFGRRLCWTAMVPFADCLNHSNVQTKYDYNIDENGNFRLYPTGNNSYPIGSEVFNSYGRRPNDNLLLDYGIYL
jgi:hypothetical protein